MTFAKRLSRTIRRTWMWAIVAVIAATLVVELVAFWEGMSWQFATDVVKLVVCGVAVWYMSERGNRRSDTQEDESG